MKSSRVDKLFHSAHEKAFEGINCLDCANCCKTTGPLFTKRDIGDISSRLKLSTNDFINKYLVKDEDGDFVLKELPCKFLDEHNNCTIYSFRPKACRDFPHTDQRKVQSISELTFKNAMICPAVAEILKSVEIQLTD